MDIAALMTADHRHIDADTQALTLALAAHEGPQAHTAWTAFQTRLTRHMQIEETVVFPAYMRGPERDPELGPILMKGHRDLRSFFIDMTDALGALDWDEASHVLAVVRQVLEHHDEREETALYPFLSALTTTEQEGVAARLRAAL